MSESLKNKTFKGMVWNSAEGIISGIFTFISGIILGRLLSPSDFGLVAMVDIFSALAPLFADSGFTNALIRKINRQSIDYSTVYVTNIAISFVFALALWFCAPYVATFYGEAILVEIIHFNCFVIVLVSFLAVQNAKLTIAIDFKTKGIINVITTVLSGILTIVLALCGQGVWSLLYPAVFNIVIRGLLYWHYQHWFPGFKFSFTIWKEYFKYGSNLLLSGLLNTLYNYTYPIVIGKRFCSEDLGYYGKADNYAKLPSSSATKVLQNVTFPVLAQVQDDNVALEAVYRRLIKLSAYVVFPLMLGMCALARPFVICTVTDKWQFSIPLLQILCFAFMWRPIHALNLNLLQVKGRSDLFLRVEIAKKIIGVLVLAFTIPFGIKVMCYGIVLTSLISLIINAHYTGVMINVGFKEQLKDMAPSLCYSLVMYIIVVLFTKLVPNIWLQLVFGTILGIILYIGISRITKSPELDYLVQLVRDHLFRISK